MTLVGHNHPDTSKDAAALYRHGGSHATILLYLWAGPATAEEIEQETGMRGSTLRPRLVELTGKARNRPVDPPLVERTERKGRTRSGRQAYLYALTDAGHRQVDALTAPDA